MTTTIDYKAILTPRIVQRIIDAAHASELTAAQIQTEANANPVRPARSVDIVFVNKLLKHTNADDPGIPPRELAQLGVALGVLKFSGGNLQISG